MKNLEMFQVQELTKNEMKKVQGGISIIRIEGWFDGKKGSRGYLFGKKIWDTY
ncbi:bacteriocin [Marinifilum sp.]|uniref:bacteriocin n=1 Tax=Marinifilum sp. TaxID=2033137 RepID=UPI003BAB4FA0